MKIRIIVSALLVLLLVGISSDANAWGRWRRHHWGARHMAVDYYPAIVKDGKVHEHDEFYRYHRPRRYYRERRVRRYDAHEYYHGHKHYRTHRHHYRYRRD